MAFEDYLKIEAMNCSTLKKIAQSPLHAKYENTNHSEPSKAFVIGDAFHGLVLEPHRFDAEYVKGLERARRSQADKEAWAELPEAPPGAPPLDVEDWEHVHAMRDSLASHPVAAEIMAGQGENELTMIWEDERTGTLCKGRADRLTTYQGDAVIADLKSCRFASPEDWGKSSARFLYHCQAAWYLAGANQLAPMERRFLFLCVEKTPPYGVTVQELDAEAVAAGEKMNRIFLARWLKCLDNGIFTAYPEGIISYGLPGWALAEADKMEE